MFLGADIACQLLGKQLDLATAAFLQAGGDENKNVSSKDKEPASSEPAAETNGVAASLAQQLLNQLL